MQHGSYINISLQFFFSNEPCGKIYVRNAVSGPLFIAINAENSSSRNGGCRNKCYLYGTLFGS
jgi:hypothetical protein